MRNGVNRIALAGLLMLLATSSALADRLLVETVRDTDQTAANTPRQGLTMSEVEGSFGEPRERVAEVGEPPISRWVYDGYTVYFEHDRVLHTVTRH
ncbi:MAG: hypothetical protein WED00_16720 [Aquisalimonadaceae bacterium]